MKEIVAIFALILAPAVFAAQSQEPAADPAPQASSHNAGSTSSKATSHDRHARKHHASGHHHRHRSTTKSHNS
jgi:Ni/Co efflux regulator RcnB